MEVHLHSLWLPRIHFPSYPIWIWAQLLRCQDVTLPERIQPYRTISEKICTRSPQASRHGPLRSPHRGELHRYHLGGYLYDDPPRVPSRRVPMSLGAVCSPRLRGPSHASKRILEEHLEFYATLRTLSSGSQAICTATQLLFGDRNNLIEVPGPL